MNTNILITVLSWEERYFLGLEQNLKIYNPSNVIMFCYTNYFVWKKENQNKTRELVGNKLIEIKLDNNKPNENWYIFLETFLKHCKGRKVIIDITTMPRESIWLSLYNCKINQCETEFIYYKPEEYGNWISRNPDKPRLLFKMSGIAKLGVSSLLLIAGGFDLQRLDSLIYNFEPKQTVVLLQSGDDLRNKTNALDCKKLLKVKYKIDQFYEYDAYEIETSYNFILKKILKVENSECFLDNYNIIFNSLGAKTSAIILFKIWLKYPQVALSYIPSKEYNKNYSKGIGESITGKIDFK
jgi:hypothetical protein